MREDEERVIGVADKRIQLSRRRSGGGRAVGGEIAVVKAVIDGVGSALRKEWRGRCPDMWRRSY